MNATLQRFCVWSGFSGVLLFFLGMVLAGMIPPPAPSVPADAVATEFTENATRIRFGWLLCLMSTIFVLPFFALISVYLRRLEHRDFPVFSYTQLAAGAVNAAIGFYLPSLVMLITAFRPEFRPHELTYLMYDFGWFSILLPFAGNTAQALVIGLAILGDKTGGNLFPRWVAYLNFWLAIGFFPAMMLVFFTSGPFAWNGLFPFWFPAGVFGIWFGVMIYAILKAIGKVEMEVKA